MKQRLIDADALEEWIQILPNSTYKDTVLNAIDDMSTIDAVPVTRCKDCKHRHLDGMIWDCPFGLAGGEDFFCAYGARMDEDV